MSVLAKTYFHNEKAAFLHLEKLLWKGGVVCPHCGTVDHASRLEGVKGKPTQTKAAKVRLGLWKCYEGACRKQFTVRVGTVFEHWCSLPACHVDIAQDDEPCRTVSVRGLGAAPPCGP